jgi:hypothetical protein
MSNVRKYLADAQNRANESFSNADGFIDQDLSFTGDDFFGADGNQGGGMQSVQQSQPYIVVVTSTSGADVSNFDILGSYQYINNTNFNTSGNLVIGSVTISSGIDGVTYREMLWQFQNNVFSVGLTYMQSTVAAQILSSVAVNTRDANGNTAQKSLIPIIDPYQQQTNVVALKTPFRIDGFTKLVIQNVSATSTTKFYFYPADNVNLARALGGSAVSKQFGSPNVTNGQTIQIKA